MNAERLLQHYEMIADAPDAIARLRRFILDLAVRGILVPQDPEDEPASELLKRIAREKARLVKAGEIRRERELPSLSEVDSSFELPDYWTWVRLGDLTKFVTSGSRDWAKHYSNEGAIFVRMGNLSKDHYRLRLDQIQRVKAPDDGEGTRTRLEADDILISITGDVGMLGLIPEGFGEAYINQHTAMVRPVAEMKGRYLAELFRSPFAQRQFNEPQRGIKNSFRLTDITQFVVPLPPLAEQYRIVAKVDELMTLCDQLEAARTEREVKRDWLAAASLARLKSPDPETFRDDARFALEAFPTLTARPDQIKQLRQTILNLAVRGKLVPQDPKDEPATELLERVRAEIVKQAKIRPSDTADTGSTNDKQAVGGRIPSGWVKTKISSVLISSFYGPRFNAEDYRNEGIPTVRTTDMTSDGRIDFRDPPRVTVPTDRLDDFRCKDGDLLVTRTGSIGTMALFLGDEVAIPSAYLIRLRFSSQVSPRYMHLTLRSPDGQAALGLGTTKVAQPNINARALADIGLRLPPLAEQYRIVARVDELMALCDQLEESLTTADETRRKLLDALLAEALAPVNAEDLQEAAE